MSKLAEKFKYRVIGEEAINYFMKELIQTRNKVKSEEWLTYNNYVLSHEGTLIICVKEGYYIIGEYTFPYNFVHVNQLCQSLLLDENGV